MGIMSKCDYGYGKKHLIAMTIFTVVLLGLAFGVYFLGIHISGSNKNLLTLVSVLGMLPAAKSIVDVIMCIRAYKYTCPENVYGKIKEIIKDTDKPYMRYDLYVTAYENIFPIYALTCFDNAIVGYTDVKNFKLDKFTEHVNLLLVQNGLKVATIRIIDNEAKFLERISTFNSSNTEISEKDYKVMKLMENISL